MPFTISHTAAVLPFSRWLARWKLLSAATIGAMVPDFRIFFPGMPRVETHSIAALITFCLPVGLITYWVFQLLIKTPVLQVLPEGPYARWRPFAAAAAIRSWRQWLLAACGVLGGALTHLVWDGFTHDGGRGVRMFPVLDDTIVDFGSRHVPATYVLQDLGSLIGLAAVLAMVCYGLRRGPQAAVPNRLLSSHERRVWVLVYLFVAVSFSAALYIWVRLGQPPTRSIVARASGMAIASLRGLAAALVIVSLALDLRLRQLHHRSSGPDR
ncbi:MAG TPA: DUF4184 family protein [Steroidobacteraceae bacterium]|jgi:hypothetical protein|nr:DUF4184 family protein [Steroidobacteraceae bacterium]